MTLLLLGIFLFFLLIGTPIAFGLGIGDPARNHDETVVALAYRPVDTLAVGASALEIVYIFQS